MTFTLDGRSTTPARWARTSRAEKVDAAGVVSAVSRCGLADVRFDEVAPPEEVVAARRTEYEPAAADPAEPTDLGRWVVGHGGVRAKPVTFDGVTLRAGDRELRVDAVTRVRAMDLMAHGPDDHFDLRTERAHIHISKSMRDKPGRIGKPSPQVVRDVRLVRGLIERHIVPRLAAEHIARVERGETLEFRNCQVDRSGIRLRRRPGRWTEIPWSEFSHLDVDRYHVEVYRSTPQADGRAGKVHFRVTNAIVLPTIVPELHRRYAR